jgi:hypothetical protein
VQSIRDVGRATQGVRLMDLEADDKVSSVALVLAEPAETPAGDGLASTAEPDANGGSPGDEAPPEA